MNEFVWERRMIDDNAGEKRKKKYLFRGENSIDKKI